jgi:hypothetical protein
MNRDSLRINPSGLGNSFRGWINLVVLWSCRDSDFNNDAILENDGKESKDYSEDVTLGLMVLCVWPSKHVRSNELRIRG